MGSDGSGKRKKKSSEEEKKDGVSRRIDEQILSKYFSVTEEALKKVQSSEKEDSERAEDFLDMALRYYKDAEYFREEGDVVRAFGALNYAHGWLDAGTRAGFFKVSDSRLFTTEREGEAGSDNNSEGQNS